MVGNEKLHQTAWAHPMSHLVKLFHCLIFRIVIGRSRCFHCVKIVLFCIEFFAIKKKLAMFLMLASKAFFKKQESPPAWMQEAYRPPCSKYYLCCPTWVPPSQGIPPARVPPQPGYPPGQGTPLPGYPPGQGTPPARVPPARVPPSQGTPRPGYPPWPGYPPSQGTPLARVPPWLDLAGYPPSPRLPHGILGNVA